MYFFIFIWLKPKPLAVLFAKPRLVRAMQNVQYRFHQIRHETNEKPTLHALLLLSSRAVGVYTKLNNYLSAKCDKFQQ